MVRKLAVLALVLFSLTAFARVRSASTPDARVDNGAGTVTGTVTSVTGNLISLAGGIITIDATGAKIAVGRGQEGTIADVKPGMQLFAALRASSTGTLSAAVITVTDPADVTLSGTVQSVDATAKTFALLGKTIRTDANTSFGGYKREAGTTFADIQPNVIVHVSADVVNGSLLAREVLLVAPAPTVAGHAKGTVQSIGTDSWTIKTESGETITLIVNAQTKIAGSPRVGDTVEVLYTINSANEKIAVSIIKFERPTPPPQVTHLRGTVKSIGTTQWTVTFEGVDKTFAVNSSTKIAPANIAVGDLVDVLLLTNSDGSLVAVAITKLRS